MSNVKMSNNPKRKPGGFLLNKLYQRQVVFEFLLSI